jgi:hypothetical protein
MPAKCSVTSTGSPAIAGAPGYSVEEGASALVSDWWRQIDRWVNEGGAEGRTQLPLRPQSPGLER